MYQTPPLDPHRQPVPGSLPQDQPYLRIILTSGSSLPQDHCQMGQWWERTMEGVRGREEWVCHSHPGDPQRQPVSWPLWEGEGLP